MQRQGTAIWKVISLPHPIPSLCDTYFHTFRAWRSNLSGTKVTEHTPSEIFMHPSRLIPCHKNAFLLRKNMIKHIISFFIKLSEHIGDMVGIASVLITIILSVPSEENNNKHRAITIFVFSAYLLAIILSVNISLQWFIEIVGKLWENKVKIHKSHKEQQHEEAIPLPNPAPSLHGAYFHALRTGCSNLWCAE